MTTAADVLVGSMLGVHTTVKVIGLTSPAATREGNMVPTMYKQGVPLTDKLNLRLIVKSQISLLCSNILQNHFVSTNLYTY